MTEEGQEYRYDVFISVKRRAVFSDWIEEHFIPNLKTFLPEDLAGICQQESCDIFYFRETLQPGHVWPNRLIDGIRRSRVALALCSPSYFQSDWCVREFRSFFSRIEATGREVLIPVSIHDGENFPHWATSSLQFGNLRDYVNTGPGFKDTKKYIAFQDEVKVLSALLAQRIKDAPPFQQWSVAEPDDLPHHAKIKQVRL